MEQFFIITKESEYFKDFQKFCEDEKKQKHFINEFFKDNDIEGNQYIMGGDGMVNHPFYERDKDEIKLSIEPNEHNLNKFGKMLRKKNKHGMCTFKKNSNIAKDFAQKCIDNEIIVNLYDPSIRDYFDIRDLIFYKGHTSRLLHNDKLYIKMQSEYPKNIEKESLPKGFIDIKGSEYYSIIEKVKNN